MKARSLGTRAVWEGAGFRGKVVAHSDLAAGLPGEPPAHGFLTAASNVSASV